MHTTNKSSVSQTMVHGPPEVRGGSPGKPLEENALQKLHQTLNEFKIHSYMFVLKLPLLVELHQKVGELVLSITSCPSIVI
jgi:hypothetical protein